MNDVKPSATATTSTMTVRDDDEETPTTVTVRDDDGATPSSVTVRDDDGETPTTVTVRDDDGATPSTAPVDVLVFDMMKQWVQHPENNLYLDCWRTVLLI